MPQKLNKAGQMQDYIPKGNGDASGEYGTSNGTNKNFTTSDKKKTEANVITENKSVVVGKKLSEEEYNKQMRKLQNESVKAEKAKDWDKFKQIHDEMKKLVKDNGKEDWKDHPKPLNPTHAKMVEESESKDNKANIIDDDLTGKKEENIDAIIGNGAKAEKVGFSSSKLEKNIPNNMRWKEWDIVDNGKALYWITQQPFDKDDLDKFKKELDNTPFEKAYVMTRDVSTYDYKEDKKNGNLQEIVKGKDIKYTPLMEEMDTYWKDFNKKYGKK